MGSAESIGNNIRITSMTGLGETNALQRTAGDKGKPEPDIFTTASDKLGVKHYRAIVVEEAVSGVQAGARGHFALVIGIARENNAHELKANGADFVVEDLAELNLAELNKLVGLKQSGKVAISTLTP